MARPSGPALLTAAFWAKLPRVVAHPRAREWVEHLAVRWYADRTVSSYADDLDGFLEYCDALGVDPATAQAATVDAYFLGAKRRGDAGGKVVRLDSRAALSRATLVRRAETLKMWFRYLRMVGVPATAALEANQRYWARNEERIALRGSKPRTYMRRERRPFWIPDDAQFRTLAAFLARESSPRDRFMMRLSYECGLRVSELVAVDAENFDWSAFKLRVHDGKGGKTADVPFGEDLEEAYLAFMEDRRGVRRGGGPLFVSESNHGYGERVSSSAWQKRIAEIRDAVGMPLLRTHTMRHLVCTDLARAGMKIEYIAKFARHASLRTTQIYIEVSMRDLRSAFAASSRSLRALRASLLSPDLGGRRA